MFEFPLLKYLYDNHLSDHNIQFPIIVPSGRNNEVHCESNCLLCGMGFSFILDNNFIDVLDSTRHYVMIFKNGNHYCDHDDIGFALDEIGFDYSCNSMCIKEIIE